MTWLCYLWHSWKFVARMGANRYWQCSRCGKRTYRQDECGYTPVAKAWLAGGTFQNAPQWTRPLLIEGRINKGGVNPPNRSDTRPPAPGGSGVR